MSEMNIDGAIITTQEELDAAIISMDDVSKAAMQKLFDGESTYVAPSQTELDNAKYLRRAGNLNGIIAWMATQNVGRVRAGTWTVEQLTALTQDVGVKEVLTDLMSLSFEIAYGKIDGLTPEILTTEIKAAFKAKLYANF